MVSVLDELKALPPLPKVHYAYKGFSHAFLIDPAQAALLSETVRVMRSATVDGDYVDEPRFRNALAAVELHKAELAITWPPYHKQFPKDASATYRGKEWVEEIDTFRRKLETILGWLGAERFAYVGALILDSEIFLAGKANWNEQAVFINHQIFVDIARQYFPSARIEWYNRGTGPNMTGLEDGHSFSEPLYQLDNLDQTWRQFRECYAAALLKEVESVTPWIGIGAAYRRTPPPENKKVWDPANAYDPKAAWQVGAAINNPRYFHQAFFAPFQYAQVGVFYPRPYAPDIPNDHWARCFIAYTKGASGIAMD